MENNYQLNMKLTLFLQIQLNVGDKDGFQILAHMYKFPLYPRHNLTFLSLVSITMDEQSILYSVDGQGITIKF